MSGCYPYRDDVAHCGTHCAAVDHNGNPCVLEPHAGVVHVYGTPPCDPNAAIRYARSPSAGPEETIALWATRATREGPDGYTVDDLTTGHRWRWSAEYQSWADMGPIPV